MSSSGMGPPSMAGRMQLAENGLVVISSKSEEIHEQGTDD